MSRSKNRVARATLFGSNFNCWVYLQTMICLLVVTLNPSVVVLGQLAVQALIRAL